MRSLRPLTVSVATAAAALALLTTTACGGSTTAGASTDPNKDTRTTTVANGDTAGDTAGDTKTNSDTTANTAPVAQNAAAARAADTWPGIITYFTFDRGQTIRVSRFSGGASQFLEFGTVGAGDTAGYPSRDGLRFALINSPDRGSVRPGDLVVIEPGGARRVVARDVAWGGIAPSWSMDGESIVVGDTRYFVGPGNSEPAGLAANNAGYLVYSDNGATRAYARTESQIEIQNADGSGARTVSIAALPECDTYPTCPFAVQAVSNDGHYVALGPGNSDPGHTYTASVILDTRTGNTVTLNLDLLHVWFTPTGAVVHSDNGVNVYDSTWTRTASFPAPAVRTDTDKAIYHS